MGWRAAEPHGGNRRANRLRCGGRGSPRNQRKRRNASVARNAAPTAIGDGINNAHTGVLQDASRAVTPTQNTADRLKNTPSRNAQRRLRNNFALGSAAALSFSAIMSDHSAAVSTPRWVKERQASGLLVRVLIYFAVP